jgi:hypothetical protein
MVIRNLLCPPRPRLERSNGQNRGEEEGSADGVDALGTSTSGSLNTLERQYSIARKSLVQSTLYVLSYLASYLFLTIALFLQFIPKAGTPLWMVYLLSITWPLSGLFNIFVYTRPKVRSLKDRYPSLPRFVLFLLVIVSGGEAPPDSQMRAAMRSLGIGENEPLSISTRTQDYMETTEPPPLRSTTTKVRLDKGFDKV